MLDAGKMEPDEIPGALLSHDHAGAAPAGGLMGRARPSVRPTVQLPRRRQVPLPTQRAPVGGTLAGHAGEDGGIKGVALRAIPPLAGAALFALLGRGILHAGAIYHRPQAGSQSSGGRGMTRTPRGFPLSARGGPATPYEENPENQPQGHGEAAQ